MSEELLQRKIRQLETELEDWRRWCNQSEAKLQHLISHVDPEPFYFRWKGDKDYITVTDADDFVFQYSPGSQYAGALLKCIEMYRDINMSPDEPVELCD